MNADEKNWLAADYALGVMRGAERVAFEAHLKRDPELSKLVLQWQTRLSAVQGESAMLCPGMSDAEVDAALQQVFQRVCSALDSEGQVAAGLNPFAKLTQDQMSALRPAVSRLIASYLVLLERLKAQQAKQAGFA